MAYERLRRPGTTLLSEQDLQDFQREVSSWIPTPGIVALDIRDYKKEGFLMPQKITYYAVIGGKRTIDNPYGLVRRLEHDDGPADESLTE